MKLWALVMCGGAIGSALRYALTLFVDGRFPSAFPLGTVLVNIIGSFFIGLVAGQADLAPAIRLFLMTGILGGFTTFSAFSLQTTMLLESGRWGLAFANVTVSVIVCFVATAGGLALAGHPR